MGKMYGLFLINGLRVENYGLHVHFTGFYLYWKIYLQKPNAVLHKTHCVNFFWFKSISYNVMNQFVATEAFV